QVFYIPEREWKPDIHHHRKTDDLGAGFEISERGALCHDQTLQNHPARLKPVSSDKAGGSIDLPLGHKDEAWSFDHIDTMTVWVPDAPRADEIVLCIGLSDGTRANP
ncbi:MAG: amino acid synthesis family protein, partial [Marinomonas sp.]